MEMDRNVQGNHENTPLEGRMKTPIGFRTDIVLDAGSSQIHSMGSACDLSLGGVFVDTQETVAVGTRCRINISLCGTSMPIVMQGNGRVIRTDASGMGIAFESMDLDSYSHLKNIVRCNMESRAENRIRM